MIVVTGGAGFIGSNLVIRLNQLGHNKILVVDNLLDGKKFKNLLSATILDYQDQDDFLETIKRDKPFVEPIEAVFHQGACSATTEWDGRYMMQNNYEYSKLLLHYCLSRKIPFIYASSAAVYGLNQQCVESTQNQEPLNIYGYSKWLFDQYVLRLMPSAKSQVVGLRYFNVYGPREDHKQSMASVAYHLINQLRDGGAMRLFSGSDGYGDGEQRRDFIYIDDVTHVNLWFYKHSDVSGIFNVGTGNNRTFNDIANTLIALHGSGSIEYIPFPDHLKGVYQSFTQANIQALTDAGYNAPFHSLENGLKKYYAWL